MLIKRLIIGFNGFFRRFQGFIKNNKSDLKYCSIGAANISPVHDGILFAFYANSLDELRLQYLKVVEAILYAKPSDIFSEDECLLLLNSIKWLYFWMQDKNHGTIVIGPFESMPRDSAPYVLELVNKAGKRFGFTFSLSLDDPVFKSNRSVAENVKLLKSTVSEFKDAPYSHQRFKDKIGEIWLTEEAGNIKLAEKIAGFAHMSGMEAPVLLSRDIMADWDLELFLKPQEIIQRSLSMHIFLIDKRLDNINDFFKLDNTHLVINEFQVEFGVLNRLAPFVVGERQFLMISSGANDEGLILKVCRFTRSFYGLTRKSIDTTGQFHLDFIDFKKPREICPWISNLAQVKWYDSCVCQFFANHILIAQYVRMPC